MSPIFSIIIPTYNRAELVTRAITSVLNQNFDNFEVIVVDDASTDNTNMLITKLSNRDERIKYIRLPENGGVSVARNKGIKEAKGKYISLLDSDDEYLPDFLDETYNALRGTRDDIGFSWTGTIRIREKKCADLFQKTLIERIWNPTYDNKEEAYKNSLTRAPRWGTGHGVTFKSAIFDQIDTFDEKIKAREDIDLFLRLVKAYKFKVIPKCLIKIHTDSDVRVDGNFLNKAEAYIQMYSKHESAIKQDTKALLLFNNFIADNYYRAGEYLKSLKYLFIVWYLNPLKLTTPKIILKANVRLLLKIIRIN